MRLCLASAQGSSRLLQNDEANARFQGRCRQFSGISKFLANFRNPSSVSNCEALVRKLESLTNDKTCVRYKSDSPEVDPDSDGRKPVKDLEECAVRYFENMENMDHLRSPTLMTEDWVVDENRRNQVIGTTEVSDGMNHDTSQDAQECGNNGSDDLVRSASQDHTGLDHGHEHTCSGGNCRNKCNHSNTDDKDDVRTNPLLPDDVTEINREKLLKYGEPERSSVVRVRQNYVSCFDSSGKIPEWVVEHITAEHIEGE